MGNVRIKVFRRRTIDESPEQIHTKINHEDARTPGKKESVLGVFVSSRCLLAERS
jgi:hypothetical protein